MITLKLSPSKIEKYRQWNEGEYSDFITKKSLIETITGDSKWTPKAEFGTAFHAVMRFGVHRYITDEFFPPFEGMDRIYRVQDEDMPHALDLRYEEIELAHKYYHANKNLSWEIWDSFSHLLDNQYIIKMRMRYDAMIGNILKEHKTTSRPDADYEFFQRSCQWRIYLMATGAERVTYERFLIREYVGKPKVIVQNSFHMFPDDQMIGYVDNNIQGLIHFCGNNVDKNGISLMKYLIA